MAQAPINTRWRSSSELAIDLRKALVGPRRATTISAMMLSGAVAIRSQAGDSAMTASLADPDDLHRVPFAARWRLDLAPVQLARDRAFRAANQPVTCPRDL